MTPLSDKTVLLFYRDYEVDKWVRGDRYLKRLVRPIYNRMHRRQKVSGFLTNFRLLVKALQLEGYDVHVNNKALARRHPEHPVGITGYPNVLNGWNLPNRAVLGRGLFDHPAQAPTLMDDPRFQFYLVGSEWVRKLFGKSYGPKTVIWYAGLDLTDWLDTRSEEKTVDVLIYDKIRWNREEYAESLTRPVIAELEGRGLRVQVLPYGGYDHGVYKEALRVSRSMIYLCEHETQGFAYQEALASNVPVLAWDPGVWMDPLASVYETEPVEATSVPYFSPECGERFRSFEDFRETFDLFWKRLPEYQPRAYVGRELTLRGSAEIYKLLQRGPIAPKKWLEETRPRPHHECRGRVFWHGRNRALELLVLVGQQARLDELPDRAWGPCPVGDQRREGADCLWTIGCCLGGCPPGPGDP
jgi:hypothetical protein